MKREAFELADAVSERHWWWKTRRGVVGRIIATFKLSFSSYILDAGCGTGGELAALSRFGKVFGMEANVEALAQARQLGIGEVREGALPDPISYRGEFFTLITLLDVLEHIDDDVAALTALRELLAPGGRILITVPAYPFLWSGMDDALDHRRRYTRASLIDAIVRAGLSLERISYFNTILFPVFVLAKLAMKQSSSDVLVQPFKIPIAPINAALSMIGAIEARWLQNHAFPFGGSLVAVAHMKSDAT